MASRCLPLVLCAFLLALCFFSTPSFALNQKKQGFQSFDAFHSQQNNNPSALNQPRGWAPHHRDISNGEATAPSTQADLRGWTPAANFKQMASRHMQRNVAKMAKIGEEEQTQEMQNLEERDSTESCWPYSFQAEQNDKLGTCCWFGSKSCCTGRFAPAIVPAIQRQLKRIKANGTHSECYLAVADLLCLWCHPATNEFLQGSIARPELHICLSLCEKLWTSCKSQQDTFGIEPPAVTARQFCAALLVEEENEDDGNEGGVQVIIAQNNKECYAGVPLGEVEASGCAGDKTGMGEKKVMPVGLVVAMIVVPLLGVLAIAVAIGLFVWHHKKKLEEDSQGFSIPVDSFPTADHLLGGSDDDDGGDSPRRSINS